MDGGNTEELTTEEEVDDEEDEAEREGREGIGGGATSSKPIAFKAFA